MQMRTTRICHCTTTEWQKWEEIGHTEEDMEKLEISFTAGKNVKWYKHFAPWKKSFSFLKNYPHAWYKDLAIPHLGIYPREKEHPSIQELYRNVHHSFICKSPNEGITPYVQQQGKTAAYFYKGILLSNKEGRNYWYTLTTWTNLKIIILNQKKHMKKQILFPYIYIKL